MYLERAADAAEVNKDRVRRTIENLLAIVRRNYSREM